MSPDPLARPGGAHVRGQPQEGRQEIPPDRERGGVPDGHCEDPRCSQRDRGARYEGENERSNPTVVYRVPVSVPAPADKIQPLSPLVCVPTPDSSSVLAWALSVHPIPPALC